jgi:Endomembrane protein 70
LQQFENTRERMQFENRMQKYVRQSFLPQHLEIHWFSIINSSVLVLLLLGILVTIFMRVLKHDFAKFSHDDELGDDAEETGVPRCQIVCVQPVPLTIRMSPVRSTVVHAASSPSVAR